MSRVGGRMVYTQGGRVVYIQGCTLGWYIEVYTRVVHSRYTTGCMAGYTTGCMAGYTTVGGRHAWVYHGRWEACLGIPQGVSPGIPQGVHVYVSFFGRNRLK